MSLACTFWNSYFVFSKMTGENKENNHAVISMPVVATYDHTVQYNDEKKWTSTTILIKFLKDSRLFE